MRGTISGPLSLALTLFAFSGSAQQPATMSFKPLATTAVGNHPALPACVKIAVQDGDPGTGPSIILLRFSAGCVIPWHWHTPNERLILISGKGHAEMKGMPALTVGTGDFLVLPSKGVHQFTAVTAVELYDISDTPFDIHYVDGAGAEIPLAQAVKK